MHLQTPLMIQDPDTGLPIDIFQIVFEKSPGSLLLKADSPIFTIAAASDAYLDVTSVKRNDVIGKSFFEVFPDDAGDQSDPNIARNVFNKVAVTGQKIEIPIYRYDVKKGDECETRYWSCSNTPISHGDRVAYILNTIVDITEEVRAKDFAIESENRLRIATEATGLATWDLDISTSTFFSSPQLATLFGHPAGTSIGLAQIRAQVDEDDMRNIVLHAFNEAMVTGTYRYEVRVYWPDDSLHWIKTQGTVLFDTDGKPERLLGTIIDVTETKRDEIRKNDFIAMASHELKTPLTSLKAYIQLLASKTVSLADPFITGTLTKANNQVNKMTTLIHGFLDLSKMEPGKIQIKPHVFDISQLIKEVIAETINLGGNHKIIYDGAVAVAINADKEKIGQVLSNFLSNAIKYSPKDSVIHVKSVVVDGFLQTSVKDEGLGIKEKDQEKLFQRFYRVQNEHMKNISGFGIGLYLASEIVQRHKGKIWVESSYGKGSTFFFSLPLD